MGTIIWLILTTAIGAVAGHLGWNAVGIGAVIGLIVGVVLRLIVAAGGGGLDDAIDIGFDAFD